MASVGWPGFGGTNRRRRRSALSRPVKFLGDILCVDSVKTGCMAERSTAGIPAPTVVAALASIRKGGEGAQEGELAEIR